MRENYLAEDSLRLAVDMHSTLAQHERTPQAVLYTAEAFYEWLLSKQDKPVEESNALETPHKGQGVRYGST